MSMYNIRAELKKKKSVKRSRQGNVKRQSEDHNPDKDTLYNVRGKAENYRSNEHIMNDSRITID